jgi:ABC-type bacteriocin/lantibiotic exporter with double-glycine peptidase domain
MAKISKDIEPISSQKKTNIEVPYIIETQNLALKFPNGETLQYPDLKINQGEKILLSGDSGSGKTTLFKLLLGIIEPSQGKVNFKNKKNEEINPDFSKIGYIPQEPILFPGTIKQNITMFNNELTSKVEKAIEEVGLENDIKKFKNGVNTELDLNKLNISGGQRQKIVLARAKIHGSKIILIDEGTSAIDQKGTLSILKNLLKSEATIVFIAHNFNESMHNLFDREIKL